MKKLRIPVFLVVMFVFAFIRAADAGETIHLHFDADTPGAQPAFLRLEATDNLSTLGFRVQPFENPLTAPYVLVQSRNRGKEGQFFFAMSTEANTFMDGSAQSGVTRLGKINPCRGGVVLRFENPKSYVAALYDFEKSDVALVSARGGKRVEIARAHFESLERGWTTVRLEAKGKNLSISVSGRHVLDAQDPSPRKGEAGIICEASSENAFDEMEITPQ